MYTIFTDTNSAGSNDRRDRSRRPASSHASSHRSPSHSGSRVGSRSSAHPATRPSHSRPSSSGGSSLSYGERSSAGGYSSGGGYRSSSASRPRFSSNSRFGSSNRSGGSRFGSRAPMRRGRGQGQYIDPTRFVNKAVITEEVDTYIPEHTFADFPYDAHIKKNIAEKGYITPTPIQDKAIPHILRGEDIVGIANTGTGKTGAFLLPLLDKILKNRDEQVIIMAPTRELAIQIDDEFKAFSRGMRMFSACCVGGAPIGKQISQLKYKNNFIIGTPGRIKDLIARKMIRMSEFKTVVLDEADRMLDMGFIGDMRFIMEMMPQDRHTLFFSATLSSEIEKLIGEFLRKPVRISVKTRDTSKSVDQDIIRVQHHDQKFGMLVDLLKGPDFTKVIVFGRTKHGVEKIARGLVQAGIKAESIHGDKNHSRRQRALTDFKAHRITALVATDVAARGLDIPNVTHVINYDVPATYEDYVHRIGRTGRGGQTGKAITFVE